MGKLVSGLDAGCMDVIACMVGYVCAFMVCGTSGMDH